MYRNLAVVSPAANSELQKWKKLKAAATEHYSGKPLYRESRR